MNKDIIIAIDGYSSCGKSTLAKALATKLEYVYIDSGALYRAISLFCIQHNLFNSHGQLNEETLIKKLGEIDLSFLWNHTTGNSDLVLNGVIPGLALRSMEVSQLVSKVAMLKPVRDKVTFLQRQLGLKKRLVMDGRDIGSNIFPEAELKLFMTASIEVRTQRRLLELKLTQQHINFDEVKFNLLDRDYDDVNRKENPLIQVHDAIVVDNTYLSPMEQLNFVLNLLQPIT